MSVLMAPVKDGVIQETDSQASMKKAQTADNNGMDKDAFLQLLVAQMQYQDPLEPTSNTEYISQYAQFSQVEQMQNMAATSELARATSLVGQEVYIKTTTSNGKQNLLYGKVDYVVFENGKAYLAIDESLYSLDDLDTVVDLDYKNAFDKAYDFTVKLNKLPVVNGIDLSYADDIDELEKIYNEMTDYEKSFLTDENVEKLKKYIEKLKEVREAADKVEGGDKEDGEGEEDSKTEGTEGAGGTGQA
nr:flagellar hook capping FlgD N-terminal domain-containing protein [uncultured Acetatifactor sp.]